jgi:hypothetical protein
MYKCCEFRSNIDRDMNVCCRIGFGNDVEIVENEKQAIISRLRQYVLLYVLNSWS